MTEPQARMSRLMQLDFPQHVAEYPTYEEAQAGTTVVLLIPARTDTAYFHDYIYGKAEIRFLRGRLHFEDEDGNRFPPAPFPSMVVVYNGDHQCLN